MHPLIGAINGAIDMNTAIIAGVEPDQWSAASPCEGWTIYDVVNHLVGGMQIFAAELTGSTAGDHDSDWLGADPIGAHETAADLDRAAWSAAGALDRTVTISLGELPGPMAATVHLTELVAHGCDVAIATGQQDRIDEQAAAGLLGLMERMGGIDAFRQPGIFGPAVEVRSDALAHLRLLAYLGRTPSSLRVAVHP
jgi:uncharacterized protein (TIGR03086 family)